MRVAVLVALSLLTVTPALAQFGPGYLSNGRHNGPYLNGGNVYNQPGGGVAPAFKVDNVSVSTLQPVAPPPLPATPTWSHDLSSEGHSAQYQQYQQAVQQEQAAQQTETTQPVVNPPVPQQTYSYDPLQPAAAPLPTAKSTMLEEINILGLEPSGKRPFNYLEWYISGAQIDPNTVLRDGADVFEDALRHFVADFLVGFWNVTMMDAALRIIMPILLIGLIFKSGELAVQKIFS